MTPALSDSTMKIIRDILVFLAAILLLAVMKVTASIIVPMVIAFFIFILINPMLSRMDKLRVPRLLSMLIALLIVAAVFVLFLYVFFVMVNMLMRPDTGISAYAARVAQLDMAVSAWLAPYLDENPETFSLLSWLNINWYSVLISGLSSVSSKFISVLSDALLVFLYLMFIILERQTVMPKLLAALPRGKVQRASQMVERMNRQTSRYLLTKVIISIATGIMFYFASILSHLDFALVWGVLAVILNFIPTIGSIVCTAGTIIMAIIQFAPDWGNIIYVTLLMISIEMVLGNIIDPRLQGVQLNISPLVILVSLAIWGYVWGIPGMFLAVPLTSMIQIICANVPSLRPIAIILSEGRYYRKDYDRKRKRKKMIREETGDVELPEAMSDHIEDDGGGL